MTDRIQDIPGYEMISELGEGGMATVYLAIQHSLDRKVAIKVMRRELRGAADHAGIRAALPARRPHDGQAAAPQYRRGVRHRHP